ncbi:MAG: exodeoxyribonuclease V subunit gamma [Chlamydiales bacterium]|nr:exodeoxyribonuclease V subunit gamma [Chlamydiales bacterium]
MTQQSFASNKMEKLLTELKNQLLLSKPLTPKVIVVPSNRVKEWIQQKIADDPTFGVAMGLRFLGLMPAMEYLAGVQLFTKQSSLALDIEGQMSKIMRSPERESDLFSPLFNYVKPDEAGSERRLRHLSDHLAGAFLKMARYGGTFLPEWLKTPGWKQTLWNRTMKIDLYEQLRTLHPTNKLCEMHFFALSAIPDVFLQFIARSHNKMIHYVLSPCKMFWGDIVSDMGRLAILKKENTPEIDLFMRDRNPLLANWGSKLNFKQLDENTTVEFYEDPEETTLLSSVQRSILYNEARLTVAADETIQLHAVSNKLREIEVLKNALIQLFTQKNLQPQDVLILAPNIADYIPYIQKVFADHCPFNFVIDDVPKVRASQFLKGVKGLIDLARSRFLPADILDFFSNPCVRKGCQIHNDDLMLIERWAKNCGVRFGMDAEHRHSLMALPGINDKMLEDSNRGTWEFAFDGLLAGLAVIQHEDQPCDLWPLDFVENAASESLGKWIRLIKNLKKNFKPMTIKEWRHWLSSFVEEFVDPYLDERGYELFLGALSGLDCHDQYRLSFESLWEKTQAAIDAAVGTFHGGDLNAVVFCSMRTGRAYPASVVWCLGMQDGAYPRLPSFNPLDDMGQKGDPYPSHADEDRHLFLELLISARQAFCMSYLSHSEKDGKPQGPSILIEELCSYLNLDLVFQHPKQGFDPRYFSKSFPYPSYDAHLFSIAQDSFQKGTLPHLIPQFFGEALPPQQLLHDLEIDINDLIRFAKNPLAHFLKQRLGVYLEYEDEDEEFHLSGLNRYLMRRNFLKNPHGDEIDIFEKSGHLPLGRFGEIANRSLNASSKKMHERLSDLGLKLTDLFDAHLGISDVKRFYMSANTLDLRAIELTLSDGKHLKIHGKIENLSPEGLLVQSKSTLSEKVKVWPLMLIVSLLEVCKSQTVFLEDGKSVAYERDEAKSALIRYVEYYLRAASDPSPLVPGWATALLQKSPNDLKKAQAAYGFTDPYVRWATSDDNIDVEAIFRNWAKDLRQIGCL